MAVTIAEKYFVKMKEEEGFQVLKNGWPSFLLLKNGKITFTQFMNRMEDLTPAQLKTLTALNDVGLDVNLFCLGKSYSLPDYRRTRNEMKKLRLDSGRYDPTS